jgi:hypothetical protein
MAINECNRDVTSTTHSVHSVRAKDRLLDTISPVPDNSPIRTERREAAFIPWKTLLLCIPSWALAAWIAVLILTAKLHPQSARSLLSAWIVDALVFFVVVSPFCWIAAAIVMFRRRKSAVFGLSAWIFVAASGFAMVCSWMALEYFNKTVHR